MKTESARLMKKPLLTALLWASVFASAVFFAVRELWVFFDPNLKFMGGAAGVFILLCLNTGLVIFLSAVRFYSSPDFYCRKIFSVLSVIALILTIIGFVAAVAILIINDTQSNRVLALYLKKDLPYIALTVFALIALLYLPSFKTKAKAAVSIVLGCCIVLVLFWRLFPLDGYKFLSDPVVMDTGEDFAVVFATDDKGTGFVEYSFGGEDYTVYAQLNGRRIADRTIHSVNIPYEHLTGNSYRVGSTRIIEEYGYGSRSGKTIFSDTYTLSVPSADEQTYLVVSDWHSYVKEAKEAISHMGDYDGVILLGDPAAGMDFEEEASEYIVKFGGDLTGGVKPAVYVRGNHETRGGYADELLPALGYRKPYYTFDRGIFSFVVLDSGEDKPDDHVEYGGLDDYKLNRAEMLRWLDTVEVKNDRVIALSHAWQVSEPEADVSAAAWNNFDRLGVRLLLSGHEHKCALAQGKNPEDEKLLSDHPDIVAYIDGGHSGDEYIASKITLTEKDFNLYAVNRAGEEVFNSTYPW